MNKLIKTRIKLSATIFALVIVSVLGISFAVKAGNIFDWGNVEDKVADKLATQVSLQEPVQEQKLGALSGPDIPYEYLSVNGDSTYHVGGPFKNATTTIVSFVNPYGTSATSTVDLIRLDTTTAATSTYSVSCGASATAYAADTVSLLDTAANGVATSTVGILENKLTAALGGQADAGTVEKITLNPQYPYFTCTVTSVYPGAFTEVTNAYDGKFTAHIHKQR